MASNRTTYPKTAELVDEVREFFPNAQVKAGDEINKEHYEQSLITGKRHVFTRAWFNKWMKGEE